MASKVVNTRIQLKNDTEDSWNKAVNFVPKQGELIIYNAEPNSTDEARLFPRFKVGDGITTVVNLPFSTHEIIKQYATFNDFPLVGKVGNLYIDLSTHLMYYYTTSQGYLRFAETIYMPAKTSVSSASDWSAGKMTWLTIEGYTLKVENGEVPSLTLTPTTVVSDITTS